MHGAVNFWLFRLGRFWGIVGLNVTKHVAIAYLCQALGVLAGPAAQGSLRSSAAQASAPRFEACPAWQPCGLPR